MNFGQALEVLKAGRRVARDGWNGKGMWLVLVKPRVSYGAAEEEEVTYLVGLPAGVARMPNWRDARFAEWDARFAEWLSGDAEVQQSARLLPWIGMKTADGGFVPWLASQTDLLAEDWAEVPTS